MLRVARCYVSSEASAEDVVQEAWLGALRGLDNFEGRSRLKTWVLRIVVNTAKTWGERERRAGLFILPRSGPDLPSTPVVSRTGRTQTQEHGGHPRRRGRPYPKARL